MKFRERFPEILERFDRWWRFEETDRPVMYITAPRPNDRRDPALRKPEFPNPADRLLPENMLARARYELAATDHFAEGYPHFFVNYGPGALHGCIGGTPDATSDRTVWFPKFLDDLTEFPRLRFDADGPWWRRIVATTELLLEEVGDEMVISCFDIGGGADIVASAVGTEQLLYDCLDRPEAVKAAVAHCHTLWMEGYERLCRLTAGRQDVTTAWYPIFSSGRTYMTQCDFNAMIGPAAFRDLFAWELGRVYAKLDHGAYHLDGPGTEVHVPALLAQRGLNCIQWTPGPALTPLKHLKMLRGIQEAGVCVTVHAAAEEVEPICRALDPRGLFLIVSCRTAEEARRLIDDARRWCGE